MNPGEGGTTVLGRTAKFRGEFNGSENMVIEGDFEGVIRNAGANVTVGPQARVRAAIAARDVIIYGNVEGQIHATGSVSLRGVANVVGDVLGSRFSMEENSVLRGRVDSSRGGEPLPPSASIPVAAAPPRRTPVLAPRPVPAPEPLVLRPVEPVAAEQPLFATPPSETSPSFGKTPTSSYGHLTAGLVAAWNKLDSSASPGASQGASKHSKGHQDPSEVAESKA
jgi:cytoskeletal protein CcmA (bactofilin family)